VDADGNVFVVDSNNNTIRRITPVGDVTTFAGAPGIPGTEDGVGEQARFDSLTDLAIGPDGAIYVAGGSTIRKGAPALTGSLSSGDPVGFVGASHELSFSGSPSDSSWRLVRKPSNSTAQLSSNSGTSSDLTPDVLDRFEVQFTGEDGSSRYVGRVVLSAPTLSGSSVSLSEQGSFAVVTFELSPPADSVVTANWSTVDGTAVSGEDYTASSGTLTFQPGETSMQVAVPILDDSLDELEEGFQVVLSNVANAQKGAAAEVRVADNDFEPWLSIADAEVVEGNGNGSTEIAFAVSLSTPSGRVVTFDVGSAPGTASWQVDYDGPSGSFSIQPGETTKILVFTVVRDSTPEEDETFYVNVTNAFGALVVDGQGVGLIINDDLKEDEAPTGVVAAASSSTTVVVSWNPMAGASLYKVFRSGNGSTYDLVGSTSANSLTDATAVGGKAYLYKVKAIGDSGLPGPPSSLDSSPDLATTVVFTDPVLTPGVTKVKASHLSELRGAVNAVRQLAGLAAATFTDASITSGLPIKRAHLTELRTAIDAARSTLGLSSTTYTDPTITATTQVKAAHLSELRDAVR